MRVDYIKLHKFKRFPLASSETFEHHFDKKMTMVIGRNGAGKSSLVGLLSPLPASKDHFEKGGYMIIHITHKGLTYKLISDFVDHPKYFFYVGEENLNTSNNITNQRELVFQHFGITQVVHDILTGKESFTDMTPLSRKKLLEAITHLNIEEIIDNYNKIKEELKNNEFLLRNTTSLLLAEKEKLIDGNKRAELIEYKRLLTEHVETLLEWRKDLFPLETTLGMSDVLSSLYEAFSEFEEHHRVYIVLLSAYPHDSVYETIQSLKTQLEIITEHQLQDKYDQLEKRLQEAKSLLLINSTDLSELQKQKQLVSIQIQRHLEDIKILDPEVKQLDQKEQAIFLLERSLPDFIHGLPANPGKRLTKEYYETNRLQRESLYAQLTEKMHEVVALEKELKELQDHKNLTCPKCDHNWLSHEVETKIQQTKEKIRKVSQEQLDLKTQYTGVQKQEKEAMEYLEKYSNFMGFYSATKEPLRALWQRVIDGQYLQTDPSLILKDIALIAQELYSLREVERLRTSLDKICLDIDILERTGNQTAEDIRIKIHQLENEISDITDIKTEKQSQLNDAIQASKIYETFKLLENNIHQAQSKTKAVNLSTVVKAIQDEIMTELSKTKVSLLETDRELSNYQSVEKAVKAYEAQIEDVQENIKVLNVIAQELSPKNGLIAKTVSQFLNVVITSINEAIASVWDYKMVLKVINVEEDVLNYRFKVEVDDRLTVDDISITSGGMKEIINLGMKFTLFKLLNLQDYPITLDEFGVRMDQGHRAKIANLVMKLLGSPTFSQIFLITHLDLAYTQFNDTEVIEL